MGRCDQDVHFLPSKEQVQRIREKWRNCIVYQEDITRWILHQSGFVEFESTGFHFEKIQQ